MSRDCTKIISEMVAVMTDTSMSILRFTIVQFLIKAITDSLIRNATQNDWISVSGNMSILSNIFAETIVSDISKN
jgi:hypothetical protein